ncbi:aquaporin [Shigella flexneri]
MGCVAHGSCSRLLSVGNQCHFGTGGGNGHRPTAGVSGVHLNPAVTIALWLFACFDKRKLFLYRFKSCRCFLGCGFSLRALLQFIFRLRADSSHCSRQR